MFERMFGWRKEIGELRRELMGVVSAFVRNDVRISVIDCRVDALATQAANDRKEVGEAFTALLDHLGLKIKRVPERGSRFVIERKGGPEAPASAGVEK